ncbi:immunity 26/phosphotriesterase HocA family protein [Bradyrhizobium sp. SSUT18]|uniref:immunity 26/phosphotriesterase HocA family protein n=1 Tax=unclassified Bradyrhizobium TaxID=2631580 RepID=UPI00244A1156|nr:MULTISPECIES: immunity 26/phosphotriesterase HocA family protein [unclassified Bradyrhizobium]MDH2341284.1 immunity 26/phosphotriesterase HocA family protein [Bradyrhizobium sp. SSUT77]MDH2401485.1 immunity 26/phosphotriesterase HocA family protein [Bradyrhizobium sp. SSUT18]
MKLPYEEGSVFAMPLRNGGFARGVVARSPRRGKVLLGYFFGPRLETPGSATFDDLRPDLAVARIRFGDLGLIEGRWLIIGKVANWDRRDWSMPDFVRRDPISRKARLVRYADDDPLRSVSELLPDYDDLQVLESDGLFGAGAAETKISKLLAPPLH